MWFAVGQVGKYVFLRDGLALPLKHYLLFSSGDELERRYMKHFPCTSYVPPNRLLWCFGLFGSL